MSEPIRYWVETQDRYGEFGSWTVYATSRDEALKFAEEDLRGTTLSVSRHRVAEPEVVRGRHAPVPCAGFASKAAGLALAICIAFSGHFYEAIGFPYPSSVDLGWLPSGVVTLSYPEGM